MRDLDETSITEAVLEKLLQTRDARTGAICAALVRHLHAFVREIRPTTAEWEQAIAFLTATGQKCDDKRQEFILLSDTLGVSTLVDAINNPVDGDITQSTVLGPFYLPAAPGFAAGDHIGGQLDGTPLYVEAGVHAPDGTPIADAVVDIWHSDEAGFYDVQQLEKAGGLAGRGQFRTDAAGRLHFWTVRPAAYPIPHDGPVGVMLEAQGRHPYRPEHVHFLIDAPGYRKLVTQIFADGDRYLDSDVVFGVKQSLVRDYILHQGGDAPDGRTMDGAWVSLSHTFVLAPADAA
jgi:hydroxyquinol 1,2-dioxygenase